MVELLEQRQLLSAVNAVEIPRGESFVYNPTGFLSDAAGGEPADIAQQYLAANHDRLGLTEADVTDLRIMSQFTDDSTGISYVYYRQQYHGIEVATADMSVTVNGDGRMAVLRRNRSAFQGFPGGWPPTTRGGCEGDSGPFVR